MEKKVEKYIEPGIFDLRYFSRSATTVDGSGVITAMFNMTDDDGSFMTYDYRADSIMESPEGPTLYFIEWSGDTPVDEIYRYECFRATIEEISEYIGENRRIPLKEMPAPLAVFASAYLMPAEAYYTEEETAMANQDLDMIDDGYHFDNARLSELKLYLKTVENDAKRRAGSGPLAHDLIRRCQRLLMLYVTGAPEFIIESEERKLAYTTVIHFSAERVK